MSRCNGASKAFAKKGRRTSSLKKVLCSVADGAAQSSVTRLQNRSSTENNNNNAYNVNFSNGNSNNNNKSNTNQVRAVRALWQFDLFSQPIPLSDFYEAYFECRRKKRGTFNALQFEVDYERRLMELCERVNAGAYYPGRSMVFIIDKPVKREVFAADFSDRIIHHLIIGKLNHLFEKCFINDSYSCRPGKGVHYAVKRLDHFIRSCSENYTKDCYILKLDIQGFFMHINKGLLCDRLIQFIQNRYDGLDKMVILDLVEKIVWHNPVENCRIKSLPSQWDGLPETKSLFLAPANCGLPIGNLTSQVFANFYMNIFDHYMKHDLGLRYYGRYVDDFVIVHRDKEYLKALIPKISAFLKLELCLTLHPDKVYLQHYTKGVKYLGVVLKPYRRYIAKRTLGNMYDVICEFNAQSLPFSPKLKNAFVCSMNSYLGILSHYHSYNMRRKLIYSHLSSKWLNHIVAKKHVRRLCLN